MTLYSGIILGKSSSFTTFVDPNSAPYLASFLLRAPALRNETGSGLKAGYSRLRNVLLLGVYCVNSMVEPPGSAPGSNPLIL